jgi:hypothetical protein
MPLVAPVSAWPASSVVVGRGSSRRGFFLAGMDNGAAIFSGDSRYQHQGSDHLAAFRRIVNVRFRLGPLMVITVSTGMELVGFCINDTCYSSEVRKVFVAFCSMLYYLSVLNS